MFFSEVIDLVEDDEFLLWTLVDNKIQSWNINDSIPTIQLNSLYSPSNNLAIGLVNVNEDSLLNTFIVAERNMSANEGIFLYWNGESWQRLFDDTIRGYKA